MEYRNVTDRRTDGHNCYTNIVRQYILTKIEKMSLQITIASYQIWQSLSYLLLRSFLYLKNKMLQNRYQAAGEDYRPNAPRNPQSVRGEE